MRVRQFTVQLLKAGKTKYKAVEDRQEDAGWRDFRINAGVRHLRCMSAQIETFVQPSGERRHGVRSVSHSYGCKTGEMPSLISTPGWLMLSRASFSCSYPFGGASVPG